MSLELLRNGILVKEMEAPTLSGGFQLLSQSRSKPNEGVVIAVGPGIKDKPMQCVPGDVILYNYYATMKIKYNGEVYLYITENNMLAVK